MVGDQEGEGKEFGAYRAVKLTLRPNPTTEKGIHRDNSSQSHQTSARRTLFRSAWTYTLQDI